MIASVVVGSMPHLTTPWLKVEALRLIQKAGAHLDDDARLQRLLPHVLSYRSVKHRTAARTLFS